MAANASAQGEMWSDGIHAVSGSRERTRRTYDRASRWYELMEDPFERRPRRVGLRLLAARRGERILDVGCGPGSALLVLARSVGPDGQVAGVDLSPAMAARAARRLRQAGLEGRADIRVSDAADLPWPDGTFDAVFASFTLELFDTPEIPEVLAEWRRVLRPAGRLVVVSLSRSGPISRMTRTYEWAHDRFPASLDCRPIHAALALEAAGFRVTRQIPVALFGLRVEAVLAGSLPDGAAG